jgi:hypothetical protein
MQNGIGTRHIRKTAMMILVETKFSEKLETLLPRLINDQGMSSAADTLGTSKSSLSYWCLKLGIEVKRVAISPGEEVVVRKIARR